MAKKVPDDLFGKLAEKKGAPGAPNAPVASGALSAPVAPDPWLKRGYIIRREYADQLKAIKAGMAPEFVENTGPFK